MLTGVLSYIRCPVCIEGSMEFSNSSTFEDFNNRFELNDVEDLVDGMIDRHLVFKCMSCSALQRFTFEDLYKLARKEGSKKVITLKAKKELEKTINISVKHLVYCGVCNGYDSKGACPSIIYNTCALRRSPHVE